MSCTRGSVFGDVDVAMGHSMMLLPWLTTANRSGAQRMHLSGPGRRPTSNAFVQELRSATDIRIQQLHTYLSWCRTLLPNARKKTILGLAGGQVETHSVADAAGRELYSSSGEEDR